MALAVNRLRCRSLQPCTKTNGRYGSFATFHARCGAVAHLDNRTPPSVFHDILAAMRSRSRIAPSISPIQAATAGRVVSDDPPGDSAACAEVDELAIVQGCGRNARRTPATRARQGLLRRAAWDSARTRAPHARLQRGVHIGGFARDRQLVRQPPRRAARLRCRERGTVHRKLFRAQFALIAPGSTRSTKALPSRIMRSPSPGVRNLRRSRAPLVLDGSPPRS